MARAQRSIAIHAGLWSWRRTILRSSLRPEARLVLLTISLRMQDTCEFIFSTLRNLVADTGLPTDTARAGLREAVDDGFIEVLEIESGYFQITRLYRK